MRTTRRALLAAAIGLLATNPIEHVSPPPLHKSGTLVCESRFEPVELNASDILNITTTVYF